MSLEHAGEFFIGGAWIEPRSGGTAPVENPADGSELAAVALGGSDDVAAAVEAARAAEPGWASSSVAERSRVLSAIADGLETRADEIATLISNEVGTPYRISRAAQAGHPILTFRSYADLVSEFDFEETHAAYTVLKEPVGVAAAITPWNFPLHQIAGKVAPALAAGCTIVLKPSEVAPLNALVLAEVIAEAGVPPGVFNLVNGDGPTVGAELARHPGIDMISITGSTRAGVSVAIEAAPTVKRVTLELGGKSPLVILDDADFEQAVSSGVKWCFFNGGQACNAPTRMLVPAARMGETAEIAKATAETFTPGNPLEKGTRLGPMVSRAQQQRVQAMIRAGIAEGARLVTGGPEVPEGLEGGSFVLPTVFADVDNSWTIAREEIFGPVLSIIGYADEGDAIEIANDTDYGLAAYVISADADRARRVARSLRAGQVHINAWNHAPDAPFGGYGHSGNGREFGSYGLDEFLEVKAIVG